MASSLSLLKSITQKCQVISNRLGKTIKNYCLGTYQPRMADKCFLCLTLNMLGDVANKTDSVFCLFFFLMNCRSSLMQLNYTHIPHFLQPIASLKVILAHKNLPSGCCQACAWNKHGCLVEKAGTETSVINEPFSSVLQQVSAVYMVTPVLI